MGKISQPRCLAVAALSWRYPSQYRLLGYTHQCNPHKFCFESRQNINWNGTKFSATMLGRSSTILKVPFTIPVPWIYTSVQSTEILLRVKARYRLKWNRGHSQDVSRRQHSPECLLYNNGALDAHISATHVETCFKSGQDIYWKKREMITVICNRGGQLTICPILFRASELCANIFMVVCCCKCVSRMVVCRKERRWKSFAPSNNG